MNRRMMCAISVTVASMFAAEAVYAAPATIPVPVHAMFSKTKLVKFNLRNDSAVSMKVKAGESSMTIDAGKSVQVQLPVGTKVVADGDTTTHKSGDVLAQVSTSLSGVTIGMR